MPERVGESFSYVAHRSNGFLSSAAAANPHIPPIHFDFVDNFSLNAFATRVEDQYFIGVNRGTVAILALVFDRLLADRSVLPFFGRVELELENLPLMPKLGPDFIASVENMETFMPPQDPSRRAVSKRLCEIALDFVIAHEFAHIANGHVDFLNKKYTLDRIDEVSHQFLTGSQREFALHRKTLEMNADEVAVAFTLVSEWKRCLRQLPRRGAAWDDIYDRPGLITMLWSYAVATLCRIFGDVRLTAGSMTFSEYPTWRLRSVMMQHASGQIIRPTEWETESIMPNDGLAHSMPLVALATFQNIERDFATITGLPLSSAGLDDAWSDVGQAEMAEMKLSWKEDLSNQLGSLAFQPLDLLSLSFFE